MKKYIFIGILLLSAARFFLCIGPLDNPLDPNNTGGDYRFTVAWDSLVASGHDTTEIFHAYQVPISTPGSGKYKKFTACGDSGRVPLDTSLIMSKLNSAAGTRKDSVLVFYFTEKYQGGLQVKGIRLNNMEDVKRCSLAVKVVNPFEIKVNDKFPAQDSVKAKIVKKGDTAYRKLLDALWYVDGIAIDTLPWDSVFCRKLTVAQYTIGAVLKDTFAHEFTLGAKQISVQGYKPEIKKVSILGSPVYNDTLDFYLEYGDKDSGDVKVFISANDTMLYEDTEFSNRPFTDTIRALKPVKDTGRVKFTTYLKERNGYTSNVFICTLYIDPMLPNPKFRDSGTKVVPLNKNCTLSVFDSKFRNDNTYRWQLKKEQIDTTISDTSYTVKYRDTIFDTIMVTGYNKFGFQGSSCALVVSPIKMKYLITTVKALPEVLIVGRTAQWIVRVDQAAIPHAKDSIQYTWEIKPFSNAIQKTVKDCTLSIKATDSLVKSIIVSVYAIVKGIDSTITLNRTVSIWKCRPKLFFTSPNPKDIKIKYKESVTVEAKASDTLGGKVQKIYWQLTKIELGNLPAYLPQIDSLSGDSSLVSLKKTIGIPYPGFYYFTAWAKDDDGFVSDTDTVTITVTSDSAYIEKIIHDNVIYLHKRYLYTLKTKDPQNVGIKAWFFSFNKDTSIWDLKDLPRDTLSLAFNAITDTGKINIRAKCKDSTGKDSPVYEDTLYVNPGRPSIGSIIADTPLSSVFINDPLQFSLKATDPNDSIRSVLFSCNHGLYTDSIILKTDSVEISFPYTYPRSFVVNDIANDTIRFMVVDGDGLGCFGELPVTVRLGKPRVTGFGYIPKPLYIKQKAQCTVSSFDANRKAMTYHVSFDNGTQYRTYTDSTFDTSFTTAGTKLVKYYVVDDDTLQSDILADSIVVLLGMPNINSFKKYFPDSQIFVNRNFKCSLAVKDPDGIVNRVYLSWNGDTVNGDYQDVNAAEKKVGFSHIFPRDSAGKKQIRCWCVDNNGIRSDIYRDSITVRSGEPVIGNFQIDSAGGLFINDDRRYFVRAQDTAGVDGSVAKVCISWNDDDIADDSSTSKTGKDITDTFSHKFSIKDTGWQRIRYWCYDNDTVRSKITRDSFFMRLGRPVIDSFKIDSLKHPGLFIVDTNTYVVSASDTNDTVRKVYISWNDDDVPEDSGIVNGKNITFSCNKYFLKDSSGLKRIRYWCQDNDGIKSKVVRDSFFIRRGAPVLWGDSGSGGVITDTLWVVVNNNAGFYYITVNSRDTNGKIDKYYWDDLQGWKDTTTADSARYQFRIANIDSGALMKIKARDNDTLFYEDTFVVYGDSAPRLPLQISPPDGAQITGTVSFVWKGQDYHDKTNTQYKVMYYKGTQAPSAVNGLEFKKGIDLNYNPIDTSFSITTTTLLQGTLNWFVLSKDQNNTQAISDTLWFDHFITQKK